jgi:hypothetical protein
MGELVHEKDSGITMESRVEIEFLYKRPAILDISAGQDFQAVEERFGFFTPVGLDKADYDFHALAFLLSGGLEHGIGLADPRSGAEEDLELPLAFPLFLFAGPLEKLVGIRSSFFHVCSRG